MKDWNCSKFVPNLFQLVSIVSILFQLFQISNCSKLQRRNGAAERKSWGVIFSVPGGRGGRKGGRVGKEGERKGKKRNALVFCFRRFLALVIWYSNPEKTKLSKPDLFFLSSIAIQRCLSFYYLYPWIQLETIHEISFHLYYISIFPAHYARSH